MKAGLANQIELIGVELTAENEEDDRVLRRFWEGGVKINAITPRSHNASSLELTFADLIGKPFPGEGQQVRQPLAG